MDFHKRKRRRISAHWLRDLLKRSFMLIILIGKNTAFIKPAKSQRSYPTLNTPPILYIPERNWRISETEQVGQVIARIRAEDAENDELVFGLEPHFHGNYVNLNGGVSRSGSEVLSDKLPFYIDPVSGDVYLKESLVGKAGENFFLYITVSDGKFTAKNEVFVNILGKNSKSFGLRPPSIQNMAHNISQFIPAFNQLPGVQYTHRHPSNLLSDNLPAGFGLNPTMFPAQHSANFPPVLNFNPDGKLPSWPSSKFDENIENENDSETESSTDLYPTTTTKMTTKTPKLKNHIMPTPITTQYDKNKINVVPSNLSNNTTLEIPGKADNSQDDESSIDSIKTKTIPILIAVFGLLVAAVLAVGCLFRKRLCAISKTLNKKTKEDMVKKPKQSNTSSIIRDDSRNFMSMQNWNGPIAYGNFMPWERDPQIASQTMTSTCVTHDPTTAGEVSFTDRVSESVRNNNANSHELSANTMSAIINNTQSKLHGHFQDILWEFPRHRLKFFNILGEGAFGQVWRCEATGIDGLEGVTTVAVKTLKESATQVEKNDLVSELQVMKSFEPHVNVVRLLGCCTDKDPLFVIIEYVNRGKLQTYLRNSRAERHYGNTHGKSNILTSADLTSFMYQIAKGMNYLTSRGIIHRDLAARNILITDDHICKVADFGFARDVMSSKIYERKSEGKLPIRWMAIESLYDNIFSVKSDIWSFGILMWEIVTLGSTPYPGISAADVMRKVRDGHRLEKPEHCRRELYNIMYYCWSQDANERPTFAELLQLLDKLLYSETDYIELEHFPDHNYYNILSLSGEKV